MQAMMSGPKFFTSKTSQASRIVSCFLAILSRSASAKFPRLLAILFSILISSHALTALAQDPSSPHLEASDWDELRARSQGPECFRRHLREAIELNHTRGIRYSQLSQGESQAITDKLIGLERLAIFGSYLPFLGYNFDERALEWQNSSARINIVCDEFISMHETPQFLPQFFDGPARESFSVGLPLKSDTLPASLTPRSIKRRLSQALQSSHTEKFVAHQHLAHEAHRLLQELEGHWPSAEGHYLGGTRHDQSDLRKSNCMLRHMLESIRRIARLSPRHHMRALDFGLRSPIVLSDDLIKAHLKWLVEAVELDRMAAPLHRLGIPIICNDVPTIPDGN